MKTRTLAFLLLCARLPHAAAQVISLPFNNINSDVPDASLSGVSDSRNVAAPSGSISDVSVTVSITGTGTGGAVNGDIYAYLQHDGALAVLLNRTGLRSGSAIGYDDNGFNNVTFSDSAANGDVHSYRLTLSGSQATPISPSPSPLTGSWAPDGRNISPLSSGASFDGASRSSLLNVFNGLDASGDWTLFVADVAGGATARLDSWGLQLTIVPEPRQYAFISAGALAAYALLRRKTT